MIESNIYLEMILHTNLDLTPIFRFSWHLGGTTPPDIAFFPDPGGILSAEKRKNANYNCQKYSQIPIQLRKCPPDFLRKSFSGGVNPPEKLKMCKGQIAGTLKA